MSISTPFRFGLRDLDTRADLSTVYCAATFATAVYAPDADLPATAAGLASASLAFSVFDDASGTTNPGAPCDQTLATSGSATVYRIEKSGVDDSAQEGVLYLTLPAQDTAQPYVVKATLDLAFVTADAGYAYTLHDDFVGVVLGLVYWPENTGLFLFFRDDGATKRISIVGPSVDGVGTRNVDESVDYDWSALTTYTILLDPSVYSRKAAVYATGSDGAETLLAEIPLADLGIFLPSVRMGTLRAETAPTGSVTAVLGLDGTDQGNYLDVHYLAFANYGRVVVHEGVQTGSSTLDVRPTELLEVIGTSGASEWSADVDLVTELTDAALHITATAGAAAYTRSEPDLSAGEWLVIGKLTARNAVHAGSYDTGMSVRVRDGVREIRLALLDDFSRVTVGVVDELSQGDGVLDGYVIPTTDVDWGADVAFTLLGSAARNSVRATFTDDESPAIITDYVSLGYPSTTETSVAFGFTDSALVSGDFYLVYLWVLPNGSFYEPLDATYPEDQGWTRTSVPGTRELTGSHLAINCTVPGTYDMYSVTDATYDETSGACVLFKALVTAWTDSAGAVSPPRSEYGPIACIRTSTVAAQVMFVLADDGTTYVYLSNEASDVSDVLAQTDTGKALSCAIDPAVAHVYMLDVKPLQYVRLYLDYAVDPVIVLDWPASDGLRALPAYMPTDAVVAVGSLGADAGVACEFAFARASIGRGYDFSVNLAVSEADLQAHVYGAAADVLVDVRDED